MSKKQKKDKAARSTRQLMGIEEIKGYCIATRMGNLVFFIIKPTNISVLPDSSISARIYALLNVVKGQAEIEMLALNSKESFERNKDFYRERLSQEELPAVRRLLEQDSKHLDRIQVLMASSREFYIIIRLRGEQESDVFSYPDGVGSYEDFIRANWLGGRTTDCVGLIKGYGWLSPETMTIDYGTHGMPDIGANQMYYSATESGTIDTMPDIPGLAVWHDGHIGVYIGGGQVIEAMGTKYGVVKTELANRGWTHWLKIPYINYD